jgi:hypothetical protein
MTDKNLNQTDQSSEIHVTWKEWVEEWTQEEVAKNLQETLINNVLDFLETQSVWNWNIETQDKVDWSKRIHINSKNTMENPMEVIVTLNPKWRVYININPLEHLEEFYYIAEDISTEEAFQYSTKFNQVFDWKLPEDVFAGTKLEKVEYPNYDDYTP